MLPPLSFPFSLLLSLRRLLKARARLKERRRRKEADRPSDVGRGGREGGSSDGDSTGRVAKLRKKDPCCKNAKCFLCCCRHLTVHPSDLPGKCKHF